MGQTIIPDSTGGYIVWMPYGEDGEGYSGRAIVQKIVGWHEYIPDDHQLFTASGPWLEPITISVDRGILASSLANNGEWCWFQTEAAAEEYARANRSEEPLASEHSPATQP